MYTPNDTDVSTLLTTVQAQIAQIAASRSQLQVSVDALNVVRNDAEEALASTSEAVNNYRGDLEALSEKHRKELNTIQNEVELKSRQRLDALQEETRRKLNQDHTAYKEILAETERLLLSIQSWEPQTKEALRLQQEVWISFLADCDKQLSSSLITLPESVRLSIRNTLQTMMDAVQEVQTRQQADATTLTHLTEAIDKQNNAVLQSLKILYADARRHEQETQQVQQQLLEFQSTGEDNQKALLAQLQQAQNALQRLEDEVAKSQRPWWKRQSQSLPEGAE